MTETSPAADQSVDASLASPVGEAAGDSDLRLAGHDSVQPYRVRAAVCDFGDGDGIRRAATFG